MNPVSSASTLQARLGRRALSYAGYHASDYLGLHADLASSRPDDHFITYGLWEGRPAAARERIASRLGHARQRTRYDPPSQDGPEGGYRSALTLTTSLHAPFPLTRPVADMVEAVLAALAALGVTPQIYSTPPGPACSTAIVIEPAALFGTAHQASDLELYARCLCVTGRAFEDQKFLADLPFLLCAGGVAAFDPDTYTLLSSAGVPAAWLGGLQADHEPSPPPPGLALRALGDAVRQFTREQPWDARPVDVAALQPALPLRSQIWGRIGEGMASFVTVVRSSDQDDGRDRDMHRFIFERSKLALHLTSETCAPPSWRWLADLAASGTVLVSEPMRPHPLLVRGATHFEASTSGLTDLVAEILNTDQGRLSAQTAADSLRRALESRFSPEIDGLELVRLLDGVEGRAL